MRVLLACPNAESPRCGIGNYTKSFAQTLQMLGVETLLYGGPLVGLYDRVLECNPDFVHVQFEYGFASKERLQILARQLSRIGKRLVLTFHSVADTPHNQIGLEPNVSIVVHQTGLRHKFLQPDCQVRIHDIPLAIAAVDPNPNAILCPREEGVRRVGWFGNVFFHKGLHELLRTTYDKPTELLLIGSKGEHSAKYFEMYKDLAAEIPNERGLKRVLWYDRWMADNVTGF